MWVRFWGVRGSIPCPGPATVRYGGNTACIELQMDSIDRMIIIDAGSGIRELGNHIMANDPDRGSRPIEIFLTHTHWDHIMGLPFFAPIYQPKSKLRIYGPVTFEEDGLKDVLRGQWTYRYFPVRSEEITSQVEFINLREGQFDIGQGVSVVTTYLNHPLLCLGYRFDFEGKRLCTVYDTEPFYNLFSADPFQSNYDPDLFLEGERATIEENQRIDGFISGADLLVYDAQYTREEYEKERVGWGHSYIEYALELARRNNVKRLALFHHDVQRTDQQMDDLSHSLCAPQQPCFEAFFAREGMLVHL